VPTPPGARGADHDILVGGAGRDWFLANLDAGARDCITDLRSGEFASDLDFIAS
jgi:hypothetical protein